MSELPPAVLAQEVAAEEIDRQIAATLAPPAVTPQPDPEAPADPATPPAPEPPADPPPPAEPVVDWEQRFRTVQGILDANERRYASEIKALKDQLAEATKPPPRPVEPAPSPITDKDREEFGPDLVDLAERVAKSVAAPLQAEIDRLNGTVAEQSQKLGTVTAETSASAETAFTTQLGELVTDWATLNVDPGFLKWCGEIDAYTGVPRLDLLQKAAADRAVTRAAQFFIDYKATHPAAPAAPAPASQGLEKLVEPSTARNGAAPAAPADASATKTWTAAEVGRFYSDLLRGAYAGREAEAETIEKQIDRATVEGRVQ